jgi:toxin secretion/phage lysis holin
MEMINWLSSLLETDDTKILYLLTLILCANIIDFAVGWVNAKFNTSVKFSSSKAIYGIARKMLLFIVLVFFVPVSLLIPAPVGISALYVLSIGYLASEINSILSHFKLTDDDKETDKFIDFVNTIFKNGGNK